MLSHSDHIPSKEIIEDRSIIEEYSNDVVKMKKISALCYDVSFRYQSKTFRDNPLLKNKGRLHGYFDIDTGGIPDRAQTIDIIGRGGCLNFSINRIINSGQNESIGHNAASRAV